MSVPPFILHAPRVRNTGVVFASAHSGRAYPPAFLGRTVLDAHMVRSSEDAFVDLLFGDVPGTGAPLLVATAPRAYVDLNRGVDELDPALIEGVRLGGANARVAAGLGVIPRVVAGGRAIYRGKLSRAEAEARLRAVWYPYHAQLSALLDEGRAAFGEAILIDCHSMPHEAIENARGSGKGPLPEIVLGDRFGASARRGLVDAIEAAFVAEGFRVARNAPFAGVYVARRHGKPGERRHVVQIEIDRALYMDEARIVPHADFAALRARLARVSAAIAALGRAAPSSARPLAAE